MNLARQLVPALVAVAAVVSCGGDPSGDGETGSTAARAPATTPGTDVVADPSDAWPGYVAGDLVPEIEESPTAATPNRHYICGACASWGALPEAEQRVLVDRFLGAELPAGFNAAVSVVHVVVPTRMTGSPQDADLAVDVLADVPGAEFRFAAVPDVQGVLRTDATTSPTPSEAPPVAAVVEVANERTFFWDAGDVVHELRSPEGDTYVLYLLTYGQDLDALGDDLVLAEGWTYEARTLDEPLVVTSDGTNTVYSGLPDRNLWQRVDD